MSAIKGKNTKPELIVRRFLHSCGLRYTVKNSDLIGRPDLVFRSRKKVVFVHGCFWHGHQHCKNFRLPKTKTEWWAEKIGGNIDRDKRTELALQQEGWTVLTVWECQISGSELLTIADKLRQ